MIAGLCISVLLAALFMTLRARAPAEPEPEERADFDAFAIAEQIDAIAELKDALAELEALETTAEISAPEMQTAVSLCWTDTEEHAVTVFLAGDYSAECIRALASREAQEARAELAAAVQQADRTIRRGGTSCSMTI